MRDTSGVAGATVGTSGIGTGAGATSAGSDSASVRLLDSGGTSDGSSDAVGVSGATEVGATEVFLLFLDRSLSMSSLRPRRGVLEVLVAMLERLELAAVGLLKLGALELATELLLDGRAGGFFCDVGCVISASPPRGGLQNDTLARD